MEINLRICHIVKGIGLFFLCIFDWMAVIEGYSTGAGQAACTSLRPGHGDPSAGASPYTIEVLNSVTTYTPGTPVTVKISTSGDSFQGLFVQARTSSGTTGTWDTPDASTNARTMTCTTADDTVTHQNINPKITVTLTWNPPDDDVGAITFSGVVAQQKLVWWNNLSSSSLVFSDGDDGGDDDGDTTTTTESSDQGDATTPASEATPQSKHSPITMTAVCVFALLNRLFK